MEINKIFAVETGDDKYEAFVNEVTGKTWYEQLLVEDPETHMYVKMVKHPAGVVTPWHTHPCAHGNYVLKGTLRTNVGDFGAGSFVWFPEGRVMEHGAKEDEEVIFLFITNKKFAIDFLQQYPEKGGNMDDASRI